MVFLWVLFPLQWFSFWEVFPYFKNTLLLFLKSFFAHVDPIPLVGVFSPENIPQPKFLGVSVQGFLFGKYLPTLRLHFQCFLDFLILLQSLFSLSLMSLLIPCFFTLLLVLFLVWVWFMVLLLEMLLRRAGLVLPFCLVTSLWVLYPPCCQCGNADWRLVPVSCYLLMIDWLIDWLLWLKHLVKLFSEFSSVCSFSALFKLETCLVFSSLLLLMTVESVETASSCCCPMWTTWSLLKNLLITSSSTLHGSSIVESSSASWSITCFWSQGSLKIGSTSFWPNFFARQRLDLCATYLQYSHSQGQMHLLQPNLTFQVHIKGVSKTLRNSTI